MGFTGGTKLALQSGMRTLFWMVAAGGLAVAQAGGQHAPFTEEAVARGIDWTAASSYLFGYGLAFADLNGDLAPDVVLTGKADGTIGIYENDGAGNFTDRSTTSGIPARVDTAGVAAGDYDADGDLDLYVTNVAGANLLLRNDGGFTFTDVSVAAGVADSGHGTGSAWGDYDGDGWLDLYVTNYITFPGDPNRLYRNQGNGTFVDSLSAAGMDGNGYGYQAVFVDHDKDGDADLYISNDRCPSTGVTNRMWENVGGSFVEITSAAGTGACMYSMGVAVGDFDRDLNQDLYATNVAIPPWNVLYLAVGDGTYTYASLTSGTASQAPSGWGANFFDFDNDTHMELFVCNEFAGGGDSSNRLYDHDGSMPCTDQASTYGVQSTGLDSFGSAVGDIDGDGDLDLMVSNSGGPLQLFVNRQGDGRRWARFRVVGEGANTFGIGTRVELRVGLQWQMREVRAGDSYKSQSELVLHFGLEPATTIDQLDVIWPGGSTTRSLAGLASDRLWTLYPPSRLTDGDQDGDTDFADFALFSGCLGPLTIGCEMMDVDGDSDVDAADFPDFLARYSGPQHDCDASGVADMQEIVDGTLADAGANGVPDGCESAGAPAGAAPDGAGIAGTPLLLSRNGDDLDLTWGASCVAGDADFAIYQGLLGDFTSHTAERCTSAGATGASLTPAPGATYYLVVPHNGAREGSAGEATAGARPEIVEACLPRDTGSCD